MTPETYTILELMNEYNSYTSEDYVKSIEDVMLMAGIKPELLNLVMGHIKEMYYNGIEDGKRFSNTQPSWDDVRKSQEYITTDYHKNWAF